MSSPQLPSEYDDVEPIDFEDSNFCFSGRFKYGNKKQCEEATKAQGGAVHERVRKDTHYLVVGDKGNKNWRWDSYGLKIQYASKYKADGCPIKIITENAWIKSLAV